MKSKILINTLFVLFSICICFEIWNISNKKNSAMTSFVLEDTDVFLVGDEISALYAADNYLWVGGRDGVKRVDYQTGKTIDYVLDDIEMIYAAAIIESEYDDSIWIGHNDGVTVVMASGERMDFDDNQISGGRVNAICETEKGIYVGTMAGCTFFTHHKDGQWKVEQIFDETNGLASEAVNVITEIQGDMWFGSYLDTNPGGISILCKDGQWQYLNVQNGLPHPYINAILEESDNVYIGTGQLTAGGLAVANNTGIIDCFDVDDGIPGEKIRYLYEDDLGYVFITTESNGMIVCENIDKIMHPVDGVVITEDNGISDNEIKCIVKKDGFYWLGGRYGLTRIKQTTIEKLFENR